MLWSRSPSICIHHKNMKQIAKSFIFLSLFLQYVLIAYCATAAKSPNIVFILTDDQDVEIGGMTPIVKAKKLIGDQGIYFNNMFVNSPLCCPSRSSILTGRYIHNHHARNNSLSGNCSSKYWQQNWETEGFAPYLKKQGYKTFFAGKYLNQYGFPDAGGVEHIPPGWDNWNGLVGNSRYYNYTLSANGKAEKHKDNYTEDYLTDVISRKAESFLDDQPSILAPPFFMMLSTPSCHAPFTPAPQYANNFPNQSAPQDGSFNKHGKDHHWLIRQAKTPMSKVSTDYIDKAYKNRWRTLLSVDDMIEKLVNKLKKMDVLDETYLVYASDNGFHLGQLSLPNDKRQLYEFDIRVPLMVRGPGIKPNQTRQEIALNIDLAPTFVALSGQAPPSTMDGQSLVPLFTAPPSSPDNWRTDFMVEHSGESSDEVKGCPQYKGQSMANCAPDCVCEDSYNNTYACVRTISKDQNLMYCEFADSENFIEVFDLKKDKYQLDNIAKTIDPKILLEQNKRLVKLSICAGPSCRAKIEPWPPTAIRHEKIKQESEEERLTFRNWSLMNAKSARKDGFSML